MNDQDSVSIAGVAADGSKLRLLSKPHEAEVAGGSPQRADRPGVDVKAVVKCQVKADGWLDRCQLISETPRDLGVGEAALRMVSTTKTDPPPHGADATATITQSWRMDKPYKPDWQRKPTADQMARYYPERAQRAEIGGSATIKCKVGAGGRLNSCVPIKETPEGYDFGKAAVRLSAEFEMTPPPAHLVDKKEVTIPITFAVPPSRPFLPPIDMAQLGAGLLILVIVVGGLFGLIRAVQADRRVDL